jgi:hypothetical protein
MPTIVTINDITGATPFDIYICDNPITTCIYIDTVSSVPYSFDIPLVFEGQNDYTLKIVDNNDCEIIEILTL